MNIFFLATGGQQKQIVNTILTYYHLLSGYDNFLFTHLVVTELVESWFWPPGGYTSNIYLSSLFNLVAAPGGNMWLFEC